jgi:hypothetical protein
MEPTMISLKVLSTAAVMALLVPMLAPSASYAQAVGRSGKGGGGAVRGPGGGGGGAARMGGGGGGGAVRFGSGASGAPAPRFNGGGGGGGYAYRRGGGGGGFIPGAVAGALVGGALVGGYGYGGPGYYAPGYYDDQYYDDGAVAVAPAPVGDDAVAYCMQTYRSYDPGSGTYMGNDGYRHPCP